MTKPPPQKKSPTITINIQIHKYKALPKLPEQDS